MGFSTATAEDVEVEAGATTEEDQSLGVGAAMESVMVTGAKRMPNAAPVSAPRVSMPLRPAREATDYMATLEAAASGREMGDLFEYRIKEPVTIRKNQSAMVPILNSEVGVEKVSLWNAGGGSAAPLRAAWLTNSTGLTLDGGSFTVLESDAFAGEGLIEPLKPGEKRLLSYAANTAVRVDVKTDPSPSRVERVRIERGTIIQTMRDEAHSVYTVRNEDAAARIIIVEHPARTGWVLSPGTPEPAESTGTLHRFRLAVDPKKTVTLTVNENHPRQQTIVISRSTNDELTLFLRRSGVGATLEAALRPVLDKKQETRIEALRRETADLQQKRSAAQAELDKLIEGLTVEETRK